MKTICKFLPIFLLILTGLFFVGCQKEDEQEYEVNFGIGISNSTENLALKCAPEYDMSEAKYIVITIKNSNGSSTRYSSSQIAIYKLNGEYFSQGLLLKPGSYKLIEFLIADSTGNIIFAVPTAESALAVSVAQPLPIIFSVKKDQSTQVSLEVISTEGTTCNDFGMAWFPIKEVIVVHVAVVDKNTLDFITAELYVNNDSYSKTFDIQANANNILAVPTENAYYNYKISKDGYFDFLGQISIDSLRILANYSSGVPLLIELEPETMGVKDIDGNIYHTVKIGNQIWMVENLITTHYRDGSPIPNITDSLGWLNATTGAYCWYDNNKEKYKDFGIYYNWYVVSDNRKLAPVGWHVSTSEEWRTLVNYLGGDHVAACPLIETGCEHFSNSCCCNCASNSSGFTALANGSRGWYSEFSEINGQCYFWTSTDRDATSWYIQLNPYGQVDFYSVVKYFGYGVRCIKD